MNKFTCQEQLTNQTLPMQPAPLPFSWIRHAGLLLAVVLDISELVLASGPLNLLSSLLRTAQLILS